ncbi:MULTISPECIES: VWA domain-containing protein [unclassified Anaerobiospirillum]|uniref:VWA domain-containing protein n=1 Tax=unclassified Anaerobiospirillum TaxID=2647410 RepID=UPI001FF3D89D|nr:MULTISPECIES: VWA domain-containing protein [unclassified Anaerobiospirillum]MCK0533911.1 VWA domain-containing protein [Anaerobiospirillum sp. NML120511]MCK0539114.1 VWA domain-containing protein [Anaerobiospirillum sp. NML02-A-032]
MDVEIDIKDKWRLILGSSAEGDMPLSSDQEFFQEPGSNRRYTLGDLDKCLEYVYENELDEQSGEKSQGGNEDVSLTATNWLNTSKKLFPSGIYEIVQKDAMAHGRIAALLQDDDFVAQLEPNMDLLSSILSLKNSLNGKALANAEAMVERIVKELRKHFKLEAQRAFYGHRDLSSTPVRTFRNLDIRRIIKANMKYYLPEYQCIVPRQLYFTPRSIKNVVHDLFVVVDQSGSMMDSYAYSAIVASVFAQLGCLNTSMVIYSSDVVDYSEYLDNVVELLFKSQLSGGTETCKALSYIEPKFAQPERTIVVLISDLYDFEPARMIKMIKDHIESGVRYLILPALGDSAPSYDKETAARLSSVGANVAVLSPDRLVEYVSTMVRG